jgi:predicted dehydrogenase
MKLIDSSSATHSEFCLIEMLRAAQKPSVPLSVMSQRRFYEPVQRMKAAIERLAIFRILSEF